MAIDAILSGLFIVVMLIWSWSKINDKWQGY